ncbi:MAG: hypothetical protein ACR2H0_00555 [Candidatus Limnocylindrales bacterium]
MNAFVMAIGPLPGVPDPVPPLPTPEEIGTGEIAISWVMRHWDELTSEQQTAVNSYLDPGPDAVVIEPLPADSAPSPEAERILVAGIGAAALEDETAFDRYKAILRDAEIVIINQLGRKRTRSYSLSVNTFQRDFDLPEGQHALAYAYPWFGTCAIKINPILTTEQPSVVSASLAHELFHCFQYEIGDSAGRADWVVEGEAEWVGETVGGPSSVGRNWWGQYILTPRASLLSRTYDAVGFYLHMAERGVNVWTLLDKMYMSGGGAASYHDGADPGGTGFLYSWGSGFFKDPGLAGEWNAQGPWTYTRVPSPEAITVPVGNPVPFNTEPYTNRIALVLTTADIVNVDMKGIARIRDSSGQGQDGLSDANFCSKSGGDCACPPGQDYVGPVLTPLGFPAFLAITGATDGVTGELTGYSLDDFCEPARSPGASTGTARGPSGPQCLKPCGGSNGDPHIRTIDGHGYDFQAAGEFVLLRAPDGSFELQARQEPYPTKDWVSINTAIAMRVNGHRVGIHVDDDGFHMLIDGQPADPSRPTDLGNGARAWPAPVGPYGMAVEVGDGTVVWAIGAGSYGINAVLSPSDALRATGVGILGPVTDGGLGLPHLPDGTALPATTDRHERYNLVYGRFADAWRVTAESSLFDYEAGRSSADYALSGFPVEANEVTLADLTPEQLAEGTAACGEIADPLFRDQCIFDVVATGAYEYPAIYALTQSVIENGADAAPPPGPLPTAGALPGDPPIRELTAAGLVRGAAAAPDGSIYLSVLQGAAAEVLPVDPQSASVINRAAAAWGGRVAFAAGELWVGDITAVTSCSISRLDQTTLEVVATYPTVCGTFGTEFVGVGDAIWWTDSTGIDADGAGGHLQRLDPASGLSSAVAELPHAFGTLAASATAVFFTDNTEAVHRIRPGETSFTLVTADRAQWFPAGDGLWRQDPGGAAVFVDGTATGGRSIPIGGSLVAASGDALYVDVLDVTGVATNTLQRYPQDGSPASLVMTGGTTQVDGATRFFSYGTGPLLIDGQRVTQFWTFPGADRTSHLYVQTAAQP